MIDKTAPFSYKTRDRFTFTKSEKCIVEQLEYLFENGNGINIIYGNRGVGKTTLKNYAKYEILEKKYKDIIVIDVPEYLEDTEFYSYILENLIAQMKVKKEQIIKEYEYPSYLGMLLDWDKKCQLDKVQLLKKLRDFQSQVPSIREWTSVELRTELNRYKYKIIELQKEINYLFKVKLWKNRENYSENKKIQIDIEKNIEKIVELKKWYQYEAYLYDLRKLQQIFDAEVIDNKKIEEYDFEEQERKRNIGASGKISASSTMVDANISIEQNQTIHSKTGINTTGSSTITHKLTFQYKKKKLTNILTNLQIELKLRINVCIDELDKIPIMEISETINRNKSFFLESGITTFLILDLGKGILFKEKYSDYITSYILCKNLSISEFLVKSSNQGKGMYIDFLDLLKSYCLVRGNNRNLIVKNINERNYEYFEFIIYIFLWQSDFYQKLPDDYKELFNNFFDVFVEHLILLGELDKSNFTKLILEFKERQDISSVKLDLLLNQFETGLYNNTLKKKFFFQWLWETSYSNSNFLKELEFRSFEGVSFYEAIENCFNDTVVDLKVLDVEESKLVLNYCSSFEIKGRFERLLEQYNTTNNDFMDSFRELSGMKNNYGYLRNAQKNIRYSDQATHNGIEDAKRTINEWRNEIIGVVFFYPKDKEGKKLINGIIYRHNNFEEIICIPYMGYIGLHSHDPSKIREFKQFLATKNVCFKDIEELDEKLFEKAYKKSSDSEEEIIKNLCKEYHYLDSWLKLIPVD